jgi:hypothetical protein
VDEALATRDTALAEATRELGERAAALAERRAQLEAEQRRIAQLEAVCDRVCDRVVARERELGELRAELDRLREEGDARLRGLTALADELAGVRRQARGQATRIRLRALRDAAELGGRMTELAARPASRDRLLDSLREAIARIGAEDEEPLEVGAPASSNGRALRRADELFDGMIEVEVGPLADFSQLVGFEDAAGGIMATSEISVKRFAQGRATLEMKLAEPVELLRELEQRAPFEFRVRDRRFDRLVLDLDAAEAA